jgi:bifunctional DNase/RNase
MIDFKEKARITREADEAVERILSARYDTFDMYAEVSKLEDLEVAKVVIKRLLDKIQLQEEVN